MRKLVLINGIIAGLIPLSMFFIFNANEENQYGVWIGYGSMIIAFSLIFLGTRSFRDKQNNGTISFGKGMQIGLLITAIASVIYAGGWEIYLMTHGGPDSFMTTYTEHYVDRMKAAGAAQEKIDATIKEMDSMKAMYRNPFFRFGMTLMEILPVGVIISLISAGVLRKKEVLPA